MEDLAPKEMPISEIYENSIKSAYTRARDTAAKSGLLVSKTEPRSKDAVDFDFDTELRRTRRLPILDRPRYSYKTLKKDDKILSGEPTNLSSSDSEGEDGEDSELAREKMAYMARRPYSAYDRESTVYGNRRYYSRYDTEDPDYFDFDLQHSIDLCRKGSSSNVAGGISSGVGRPVSAGSTSYFNGRVVGSNPALWGAKDFEQLCNYKSDALLSKQLYSDRTRKLLEDDTAEGSAEGEAVASAAAKCTDGQLDKGLMAMALRTPSYWTRRFENLTHRKYD